MEPVPDTVVLPVAAVQRDVQHVVQALVSASSRARPDSPRADVGKMVLSQEVRERAIAIADLFSQAHTEAAAGVRTL